MNTRLWTNIYIVGMYLMKMPEVSNLNLKYLSNNSGAIFDYLHKEYGHRAVMVTNTTDLDRTIFIIENDDDSDFEYVMNNKEDIYYC